MTATTHGHAFVTGGAGGIGLAIAQALVANGMRATLADLDADRLAAAARSSDRLRGQPLDVTDEQAWRAAADEAEAAFGPVRILVNSAGLGAGAVVGADIARRWRLVQDVNAFGPFLGANLFVPRMTAQGGDTHIVNVASLAGLYASPSMSAYNASKYALVGLSDTLRLELAGTGIGVSVVYPGPVNTGFLRHRDAIVQQMLGLTHEGPDMSDVLASGMAPDAVARIVVAGVAADAYHIFTHGGWRERLESHFADRLAAYGDEADFAERQAIDQLDTTLVGIMDHASRQR